MGAEDGRRARYEAVVYEIAIVLGLLAAVAALVPLADLRGRYERKLARFDGDERHGEPDLVRLVPEILGDVRVAERQRLLALRNGGAIDDAVLRRLQRELDLDEVRFGSMLESRARAAEFEQ